MKILHEREAEPAEHEVSDWLSELMDGEVDDHDRASQVKRLCLDPKARERWALYHGIGDAMRGAGSLSPDFNRALSARLAAEPTVLAPRLRRFAAPAVMALAASVAVVSVVTLMPGLTGTGGLQLAQADSRPNLEIQVAPYLVAHQEFSPMAVASPYQRAVMTVEDQPAK